MGAIPSHWGQPIARWNPSVRMTRGRKRAGNLLVKLIKPSRVAMVTIVSELPPPPKRSKLERVRT